MLDLLRYGLPSGAAPILGWLQERARRSMEHYLRALRRGEEPQHALQLSGAEAAKLLEAMPAGEVMKLPIGSVIGVHAGPGLLAVCFMGKERSI